MEVTVGSNFKQGAAEVSGIKDDLSKDERAGGWGGEESYK